MVKLKLGKELRSLLKKVSRTLYLSISILPEQMQAMLGIGYLVCRAMDTVVDSSDIPASKKKELLALFRKITEVNKEEFEKGLRGPASGLKDKGEKELLEKFPAVAEFVKNFNGAEKALLSILVKGVSRGMETDLDVFSGGLKAFRTEKELLNYCRLIGGVPGIYWYGVYNLYTNNFMRAAGMRRLAYHIGAALQITNVLKDLSADLKNGRCYLPLEDLKAAGLSPEQLNEKENISRLRPVLAKWAILAVDLLDSSEKFLSEISKSQFRMRAAVVWPVYWAMDSLYEITQSNPLAKRSKISRMKIYSTIAGTPSLLLSNGVFQRGYRFRRETLIVSLNNSL
ncbi:MAG: hypothetical protein COT17_03410 [Elusimicrobia bacterium CG08_land_8_20_14_0_20_51_18]|nr:MAG: hypothetical protein COT17_03410 [Elusimicrobia bacterium CG08_land_8_20_14_0_20_51_18]